MPWLRRAGCLGRNADKVVPAAGSAGVEPRLLVSDSPTCSGQAMPLKFGNAVAGIIRHELASTGHPDGSVRQRYGINHDFPALRSSGVAFATAGGQGPMERSARDRRSTGRAHHTIATMKSSGSYVDAAAGLTTASLAEICAGFRGRSLAPNLRWFSPGRVDYPYRSAHLPWTQWAVLRWRAGAPGSWCVRVEHFAGQ